MIQAEQFDGAIDPSRLLVLFPKPVGSLPTRQR